MLALANLPLPGEFQTLIFAAIGVLARLSLMVFLLPALGELAVPVRLRAMLAVVLTVILVPMVAPMQLAIVEELGLVPLIVFESLVGFALGFTFRILILGLQVTGTIIAQTMSLSQLFGQTVTVEPNPSVSMLLVMAAGALFVTLDFHTYAVGLLFDSYQVFPLGQVPATDALGEWATERTVGAFRVAVALAVPFLLIGFLYNAVLGLINQAMPQMMVTFIGVPANVLAGLVILGIAVTTILVVWLDTVRDAMGGFW